MEPSSSLSNINYSNNTSNYCFNCHSYLPNNNLSSSSLVVTTHDAVDNEATLIKEEEQERNEVETIPQTSTTISVSSSLNIPLLSDYNNITPSTTVTEDARQSYLKAKFIEALSYVFELHADHIAQLQQLSLNQMKICPACDEHLTNVYQSRKAFLSLTAPSSRVFAILTTKYDDDSVKAEEFYSKYTATFSNDIDQTHVINFNDDDCDDGDGGNQFGFDEPDEQDEEDPLRTTPNFPVTKDSNASTSLIVQPWIIPSKTHMQLDSSKNELCMTKLCHKCNKLFPTEVGKTNGGVSSRVMDRPLYEHHIKVCTYTYGNDTTNPSRAVSCSICHNPSVNASYLKQHLFEHMGPEERIKELTCTDCEVVLCSLRSLATHRQTAHGIPPTGPAPSIPKELRPKRKKKKLVKRPYVCPECGKSFCSVNPLALQNHINLIHSKETCEVCARPIGNPFAMKLHLQTHLGPTEREGITKPFLCAECGASFSHPWKLKHHITLVHDKSKPRKKYTYTCEKCNAVMSELRILKRHLHGHEMEERGETNFNCSDCPMKFKFKIELREHKLSCSGQVFSRPFECLVDACSKRFKNKQALELHLNETHKYGPQKAREMVYPGLPPKKCRSKDEMLELRRRTARERKAKSKLVEIL